jgi:hypothetical protein
VAGPEEPAAIVDLTHSFVPVDSPAQIPSERRGLNVPDAVFRRVVDSFDRDLSQHPIRARSRWEEIVKKVGQELAVEIAGDESTLEFLSALPRPKQQPNLLFAAVRYVCGTPRDWEHFPTSMVVPF